MVAPDHAHKVSAIVGLHGAAGGVRTADVDRMLTAVAHRGPDGAGAWSDGHVGLGHRLLRVTPGPPRETLPLVSARGQLTLTADARVDNRSDLIRDLGLNGRAADDVGDGELILAAYERWGDRAPEHLIGDFSFAIWDRRRQALLCVRDRLGVRPLYYVSIPGLFAFATEIGGLQALSQVPRRLNEARVAEHLAGMVSDKTSTFYLDILRLLPGHCLSVQGSTVRVWPYWRLDPERQAERASDEAYADEFRTILVHAVRCRLRAILPVGATLSGGLDSSAVACIARDLLRQDGGGPLRTFSAIFPDLRRTDELRLIDSVLQKGGLDPDCVRGDRLDALRDLDRRVPGPDEPDSSTVVLLYGALFDRARQHGVRVVLDGLEGDAAVSHGSAYPLELARTGRWIALATEIRAFAATQGVPAWRLLCQSLSPLAPSWIRGIGRRMLRRDRTRWESVIRGDLARRVCLEERWDARRDAWLEGVKTARHDHWRRIDSPVVTHTVETVNRTAARFSIEPRHPFLDSRLIEFALALPGHQKLRRGLTRMVLRAAMAGVLPEEIRWRKGKADLRPIIPHAFGRVEPLELGGVLDRDAEVVAPYVDLDSLRAVRARYACNANPRDAVTLWRTVTLGAWLRTSPIAGSS
jgi:asparagine synthase (glutamine-hydrolysing)